MGMSKKKTSAAWQKAFKARTQLLRDGAGYSQGEMARELGVPKDTYAKWENRPGSIMPHDRIPKFLEITGGSYGYLFEGHPGSAVQDHGDKNAAA